MMELDIWTDDYREEVLIVTEPPREAVYEEKLPLSRGHQAYLERVFADYNFGMDDFAFLIPCPNMTDIEKSSEKRAWDFIKNYREEFLQHVSRFPNLRLIVTLGKHALRQVMGKAVKITKARGRVHGGAKDISVPVLPWLGIDHVTARPEFQDLFASDIGYLGMLWDAGFDESQVVYNSDADYRLVTKFSSYVEGSSPVFVDSEFAFEGGMPVPICIQIGCRKGEVAVVPLLASYWGKFRRATNAISDRAVWEVRQRVIEFLEDETILKVGHNFKADIQVFEKVYGIKVRGWVDDTMQMAFAVDENMQNKGLAECLRRWVPEFAGYNEAAHDRLDFSDLRTSKPEELFEYAAKDVDALIRLHERLSWELRQDADNCKTYHKIQMPVVRAFCKVEQRGVKIDRDALTELRKTLEIRSKELYKELLSEVPTYIKAKHFSKGLKFSRAAFVQDILFSKQGFGFTPVLFTKGTEYLPDKEKVPQVGLDHLAYFEEHDFVAKLKDYQRLTKLQTTYVGVDDPDKPKGFYQYLRANNGDWFVDPKFWLHRTVTGRAASSEPNFQNWPKRGEMAKAFRNILIPRDGYRLLEVDQSQAELRVAAWEALDSEMIRIYRSGGDIHTETAATCLGMPTEDFLTFKEDGDYPCEVEGYRDMTCKGFFDLQRFRAKAVNFGFLYRQQAKGFQTYAKTDYGIDFTLDESEAMRSAFFRKFYGLDRWHVKREREILMTGESRALHGAVRRLPSVSSNDFGMRNYAIRQGINFPIQRFASDFALIAMCRFMAGAPEGWAYVLSFIHDSVLLEVREDRVEEVAGALLWLMQDLSWWEREFSLESPLPFVGEAEIGERAGAMEPYSTRPRYRDWLSATCCTGR